MTKPVRSILLALLGRLASAFALVAAPLPVIAEPSWINDAVIYGIAPWYVSERRGHRLDDIAERIPELKDLGVNTIWLQPVYANHGKGQAYDVTDYFKLWPELGSEADLRRLVTRAHAAGLRVIFDFVANHTSIHHPFAKDSIRLGERSRHYDFYQREPDQTPYSQHYHRLRAGRADFIYYFWKDLVNLNFESRDVREHLIEAARHWVRDFDIDGYRFDAAWAPAARRPSFFPELREALRRIKPDVLMLAEDKPLAKALKGTGQPQAAQVFDVVYDWSDSAEYISDWSWSRGSPEETIFNAVAENERVRELRRSLAAYRRRGPYRARLLRYIENNDHPRFINRHSVAQTKTAALLTFTVPGVPLVYYGQEIGTPHQLPAFENGVSIRAHDETGLWPFYRNLIHLRRERAELGRGSFAELKVADGAADRIFAFKRAWRGKAAVVVLNLGSKSVRARLEKPAGLDVEGASVVMIRDLASGERSPVAPRALFGDAIQLRGHEARLYLLNQPN